MDRINARLADLVQSRARLAREIGALKSELGLPATARKRERDMLARILRDAPLGFERADLERIFRTLFAASRRLVIAERRRK